MTHKAYFLLTTAVIAVATNNAHGVAWLDHLWGVQEAPARAGNGKYWKITGEVAFISQLFSHVVITETGHLKTGTDSRP